MKIYTKTGDTGETGLYRGGRVKKNSTRIEAYGTVDELNSIIGWVRTMGLTNSVYDLLGKIQNDLFVIGADLSTPEAAVHDKEKSSVLRLPDGAEIFMEHSIDDMEAELEPLTAFILPGGSTPASAMHIARSVCRRAERCVVTLMETEQINGSIVKYLNRLSDLLFVMARYCNKVAGLKDVPWEKEG